MKYKFLILLVVLAALLLTGCTMRTIDQMYCLPRRSDEYNNLQSAMDEAMNDLEYCAPVSGENQQTVQMVDLDGDGTLEYLLFAKGTETQPLRILIFRNVGGDYRHVDTIKSNGYEFDQVEYIKMDNSRYTMLVVGKKISDQVTRSLSVYSYNHGSVEQLLTTSYRKFIPTDFNGDGISELFVLRSGITETDNGIAEIYTLENGAIARSNEVNMSQPAYKLKRVITGKLQDNVPVVFATSTVGDNSIVTDIFAFNYGSLTNVTISNNVSTVVRTMRNYYVYADDIDDDGVVELPDLLTPATGNTAAGKHDLILWYTTNMTGEKTDKMYTYHNFISGWYIRLDSAWAEEVTVSNVGSRYEFFIRDTDSQKSQRVFTICLSADQSTDDSNLKGDIILLKTESITFTASLDAIAEKYNITKEFVISEFNLIAEDWKTGEM